MQDRGPPPSHRFRDQFGTGAKHTFRLTATVPGQHADCAIGLQFDQGGRFGMGDARQQQARQTWGQFVVAGGVANHRGHPRKNLDPAIRVTVADAIERLAGERDLLNRPVGIARRCRGSGGCGGLGRRSGDKSEDCRPDHKLSTRRQLAGGDRLALVKQRIASLGQFVDKQAFERARELHMGAGNLAVPRRCEEGVAPEQPGAGTLQRPAVAGIGAGSFGDQRGCVHGSGVRCLGHRKVTRRRFAPASERSLPPPAFRRPPGRIARHRPR